MARQRIKPGPLQLSSGALPQATLAAHHYPKSIYMQVPIITAAIHVGLGNTKSTLPPVKWWFMMVTYT